MSIETIILVSNYSDDSAPSTVFYSEKQKGAGYHRNNNGVHTALFTFDNFVGSAEIQATLALYPGDDDWFDVNYDTISVPVDGTGAPIAGAFSCTFNGKFVWIRAAYTLQAGSIVEIRYNL